MMLAYLKCVGNISVIKQSKAAFPHEITLLNTAETTKLCNLLYTKYIDAAQIPEVKVLNTDRRNTELLFVQVLNYKYIVRKYFSSTYQTIFYFVQPNVHIPNFKDYVTYEL